MTRNRKWMLLVILSIVTAYIATAVAASPWMLDTPLYTYRMQQASSEMNFLPATMNNFTYMTEKGFTLVDVEGCCEATLFAMPLGTGVYSCYYSTCGGETCSSTCYTYCGQYSCMLTCPSTCFTCDDPTCPLTCYTCPDTFFCTCDPWACPEK